MSAHQPNDPNNTQQQPFTEPAEEENPWSLRQQIPAAYPEYRLQQQQPAFQQTGSEWAQQQFPQTMQQQPTYPTQLNPLEEELAQQREISNLQASLIREQQAELERQRQRMAEWEQERSNDMQSMQQRHAQHQAEIEQVTRHMHNMYENLRPRSPEGESVSSQLHKMIAALEQRVPSQQQLLNQIQELRDLSVETRSQASTSTIARDNSPLIAAMQQLTIALKRNQSQRSVAQESRQSAAQRTTTRATSVLASVASSSSGEIDDQWATPPSDGESTSAGSTVGARRVVLRQNETTVRKRRLDIPPFQGTAGEDPYAWLLMFEKAKLYHEWSDDDAAKEFMMSMHKDAVYWWDSLTEAEKGNYTTIKEAFTQYFGGGEEAAVMALGELPRLQQKNESMVTFGARLKLALSRIDSQMKEELKLYFFHSHARDEVAKEVSRYKPATLDKAIQYAIYLERTDKTAEAQNRSKARILSGPMLSAPTMNHPVAAPPSAPDTATPMEDVQMNAQRRGKSGKGGGKNKKQHNKFKGKCFHCKKRGHKEEDCWTKKGKGSNEQTTIKQQSSQQATLSKEDEEDEDFVSPMFDFLQQNSQTATLVDNIPVRQSVQEDDTNRSVLRFKVQIQLGCIEVWALIDTGSEVTSMDKATLEETQLQSSPASPIYIQYGNKSRSLSNQEVCTTLEMNQQTYRVDIRVVPMQNTKVILGMDWLVGVGVYLDPETYHGLGEIKCNKR
ncbi:hypothetical protein BJV82DRAFT_584388 [Fennellomyces sp. T-0311]|nr:hypothetical protein BJV82DRAFT_584388 [Fennellomyces sp. T-0311]